MESFFYTLAAALVSGVAVIAWTTPAFFTGVFSRSLLGLYFFAQFMMQIWDIAIGFMFKKVAAAFPAISGEELLKISQSAKIPDIAWILFWGSVLYIVLLLILAYAKESHDEKQKKIKS